MPETMEVYKCNACGNIVEVLTAGEGELICCGAPMVLMSGNTTDAAVEKHAPTLARSGDGWQVNVGSVDHPMSEEHYIAWIELSIGERVYREYLKPGDKPAAFFPITAGEVKARTYCNLHGLWKSA